MKSVTLSLTFRTSSGKTVRKSWSGWDDGVPGLAVHEEPRCKAYENDVVLSRETRGKNWRITHTRSGSMVADLFPTRKEAVAYMHAIASYADWTLDGKTLERTPGLGAALREKRAALRGERVLT